MVVLSKDQLKRLHAALVSFRFAPSLTKARKMTVNPESCRHCAVKLFSMFGVPDGLEDVSDLYIVPDVRAREASPPTHYHRAAEPVARKVPVRGKGKKPAKVLHNLRIEQSLLDRLRGLGGNVSAHIRIAVDEYLQRNAAVE